MVDLAVQAFTTNNYDLAAQIYERTITEYGPKLDLYLGLADSLAKSGDFKKAFEAYSNAYRLGKIGPEKLKHLVSALVDNLAKKEGLLPPMPEEVDMFSCALCKAVFIDPVTVPCGHTFCRKCLLRDETGTCRKCNVVIRLPVETLKSNILLSDLTQRWFPEKVAAVKLKADGNDHFAKRMFKEAIDIYTKALELVPTDHTLVSNRANVHAALHDFQASLHDAETAIRLRPDWPKAYFRKGSALVGLGRHEEAVLAFLQCLALDPTVSTVRNALAKALHKVLTPVEAMSLKHQELQAVFNPSPLSSMMGVAPPSGGLMLNAHTLAQLKEKLKENLTRAGVPLLEPPSSQHPNSQGCSDSEVEMLMEEKTSICHSAPTSRTPSPDLHLARRASTRSLDHHPRKRASGSTSSSDGSGSPYKANPRKHARSEEHLPGMSCGSAPSSASAVSPQGALLVDPALLDKEDLECSLCLRLFWNPVTTPCGHTFCRGCLDRCLDHNCSCPLCKTTLAEYLAERRQAVTETVVDIIKTFFPTESAEREKIHEEEILEIAKMGQDKQHEIPVFVCTLGFPSRPCPLHIFEPRYRLMVRQCMEAGTRQFGMCIPSSEDTGFSEVGTMLEIRDVQYFPDGRSVLDAVGGKRFRVLSRGMRDGYDTAKVEFISDIRVEGAEAEELKTLHDQVHKNVKDWLNGLPRAQQSNILGQFGQFPECDADPQGSANGPAWLWWIVALLPLDPRGQLAILAMTSLKDRLVAVKRVLTYVKRNRSQ